MAPFSLDRAAKPVSDGASQNNGVVGAAQASIHEPKAKIPKLSDLIVQGPRPLAPSRLPDKADVQVCIYKTTDDASTVWEDLQNKEEHALWQIQFKHEARDSLTFNIYDSFNDFLKNHKQETMPRTLIELQSKALIKLAVTGKDVDSVGFQQWRPVIYVAGKSEQELHNALYLLDDFWTYKCKDRAENVMIVLNPHIGVQIGDTWDHLEYPAYTMNDQEKKLPMSPFECQPVQGRHVLTMTIQIETESVLSAIFHGQIWGFRDKLQSAGVAGFRHEDGSYFRAMPSVDVSEEKGKESILNVLDNIFHKLVARVVVEGEVKPGTAAYDFHQLLKDRSHLFFV